MLLEKINDLSDLRKLSVEDCILLADEIRDLIINKLSQCGGHLGSNLGIVEMTIAIHYVFESPEDKIVFDVSHQSATHKILTGRKEAFINPQKYREVSGYMNSDESEHDLFKIGHTSTSLSLACGIAKARDLRGSKENVIAVIGDGALSGGEALEGLDYGGTDIEGNLIVIVNDNQMSIAENHGGIYKNLKELRDTKGEARNNIFKALGYDYYYVAEGNNVKKMIEALQKVKDIDHPIVIHVCTKKGKGYPYAEEHQEITHYIHPFYIETGLEKKTFSGERYDYILKNFLIEKMKKDSQVAMLVAATPVMLSFSEKDRKALGARFIDVGIAEEHAVAMAAGMARNGGKPVFATKSSFFQRTYDQVSQELCINKLPVTLIVINASVYATTDATHIGIFDISMLSNIPNLVYLAPTNKQEYLAMVEWSIDQDKYPVAIRAPRNGVFNAQGEVEQDYSELNRYLIVQSGEQIAIIALGDFYQIGEELVKKIDRKFGWKPTLINPRYITGIDEKVLHSLLQKHRLVITMEDGILEGGFGEKIARFYSMTDIYVKNYGLKKEFLDRYDVQEVMKKNHLEPDIIIEDIVEMGLF